jgi:hypothetical protein
MPPLAFALPLPTASVDRFPLIEYAARDQQHKTGYTCCLRGTLTTFTAGGAYRTL